MRPCIGCFFLFINASWEILWELAAVCYVKYLNLIACPTQLYSCSVSPKLSLRTSRLLSVLTPTPTAD